MLRGAQYECEVQKEGQINVKEKGEVKSKMYSIHKGEYQRGKGADGQICFFMLWKREKDR